MRTEASPDRRNQPNTTSKNLKDYMSPQSLDIKSTLPDQLSIGSSPFSTSVDPAFLDLLTSPQCFLMSFDSPFQWISKAAEVTAA